MMLSTSATYTGGAVPVVASCHDAAVSAALRLNRRLAPRTKVLFTSPRGLHDVLETAPRYLRVPTWGNADPGIGSPRSDDGGGRSFQGLLRAPPRGGWGAPR